MKTEKVLKHLQEKGFNCIESGEFPDIFAWKPFMDMNNNSPVLHTQTTIGDKIVGKTFIPFFVALVGCKKNKKLNKKEKQMVKSILDENRCNLFLVAYEKKGKIEFEEMEKQLPKAPKVKEIKKELPSYFG